MNSNRDVRRYARPASLDAATALIAGGAWSLLAGGTDLYPAHVGRPFVRPLLDLGGIAELRGIRRTDSGWTLGATTTWTDVLRADLPPLFDALKQAAREVGGVQIQNTGTLAGNLCNASPAADGTPVAMAMDVEVVLRSVRGERVVPAVDFVLGSRRTACAADEIVVALRVPARRATGAPDALANPAPSPASSFDRVGDAARAATGSGTGKGTGNGNGNGDVDGAGSTSRSIFLKLGGRRHLTISMTMVAVVLDVDVDGLVTGAGIAVGSCSARAQRLNSLERKLVGAPADASMAARVAGADLAPLTPIVDLRATAAYRLDATTTLLRRALGELACAPGVKLGVARQPGPGA